MSEELSNLSGSDKVAAFSVGIFGCITLTCILACVIIAVTFLINPPW
jgi:hypothetical protein